LAEDPAELRAARRFFIERYWLCVGDRVYLWDMTSARSR
jgi:hypothetical protein